MTADDTAIDGATFILGPKVSDELDAERHTAQALVDVLGHLEQALYGAAEIIAGGACLAIATQLVSAMPHITAASGEVADTFRVLWPVDDDSADDEEGQE